jgi:hypothetical protein
MDEDGGALLAPRRPTAAVADCMPVLVHDSQAELAAGVPGTRHRQVPHQASVKRTEAMRLARSLGQV